MRFFGLLLSAIISEFRAIFGVVPLLRRPFWIAWGLCVLVAFVGLLPGAWAVFAQLVVLIGLGLAGLFSGTLAKRVRRQKWVEFPDGPEVDTLRRHGEPGASANRGARDVDESEFLEFAENATVAPTVLARQAQHQVAELLVRARPSGGVQ